MHKCAFRDALALWYGWPLQNPPSHCTCGYPFNVDHALTCKTGGFPAIRHNEVRDITASLLSEVCHGVTIEPHLQPLTGELMQHKSFTPLVFLVTGGMGRAATTFYSRLASMISEKRSTHYSNTLNWIRCKLSFALLRASIMSIRGARSSRNHPSSEANHIQGPIDLQMMGGLAQ